MGNLFWLTDERMARLRPFFPKSHGEPRVDDRRSLRGIIFNNRNGLRWCDAPGECGPPRTLCHRGKRGGDIGGFARMMEGLVCEGTGQKTVMIDATRLKRHGTASGLRAKKGARRQARTPDRAHDGRAERQPAGRDGRQVPPLAGLHGRRGRCATMPEPRPCREACQPPNG